jgi:hypothetical protein
LQLVGGPRRQIGGPCLAAEDMGALADHAELLAIGCDGGPPREHDGADLALAVPAAQAPARLETKDLEADIAPAGALGRHRQDAAVPVRGVRLHQQFGHGPDLP